MSKAKPPSILRRVLFRSKWVGVGLVAGVVIATVGSVVALNGWFGDSVPSDTFTRGLVGYWSFDEGSGSTTYDSSGQGHHGQLETYVWACGDTLTDSDGQTYDTVLIGSQCWMAENLNVDPVDAAKEDCSSYGSKYCYFDDNSYCNTYGGLYQWNTMMCGESSSNLEPSGVQGICPAGWHIPSGAEYHTLEDYLDESTCDGGRNGFDCDPAGSKMAGNASLWANGALDGHADFGASGLNVLPAGYRETNGSYENLSVGADLWSSYQYNDSNALKRSLYYYDSSVYLGNYDKASAFSVRCVRD